MASGCIGFVEKLPAIAGQVNCKWRGASKCPNTGWYKYRRKRKNCYSYYTICDFFFFVRWKYPSRVFYSIKLHWTSSDTVDRNRTMGWEKEMFFTLICPCLYHVLLFLFITIIYLFLFLRKISLLYGYVILVLISYSFILINVNIINNWQMPECVLSIFLRHLVN